MEKREVIEEIEGVEKEVVEREEKGVKFGIEELDVPRAFIAGAVWCRKKMWVEMKDIEDACLGDGELCVVAVFSKSDGEYLGMTIAPWDVEKGEFALGDDEVEVRRFIVIPDYEEFAKK